MNTYHEFRQMLGEPFGDHFAQLVVFLAAEEAQTASAFLPLANEPGWIDSHLAVANPFPIAERDKRLVAVGRRSRFAVLTEPAFQFPSLSPTGRETVFRRLIKKKGGNTGGGRWENRGI